ncbi:MAG: ribosome biogenesis GTP-binding protein YihA/YsxC [Muribaculaceae bacterium]|nr:ribosome biogenesis GTP-binding protein YihA/YsxC [Muribaculaceae bacterium]
MQIKSAKFEISNSNVNKCPAGNRHEYAFIGRSNVGKSSLINMLTGQRKLAMTSATPGKTTLINHFLINDDWYIVDLPGYGYAQRSKSDREKLQHIIEDYVLERAQMVTLFVLVDSRLKPQKIDLEFMEWLGENGVPFSIVFTKIDKLGRVAAQTNIEAYKTELLKQWEELPPVFVTSSERGDGRKELLDYIEELNNLPKSDLTQPTE